MAHNIRYSDHKENVDRKAVQAKWDHYVAMETWQEGCGGVSAIRWLENAPVQADYEAAEEYISAHDKGWYDCLAVRYYETAPDAPAKKPAALAKARDAFIKARDGHDALRKKLTEEFLGAKSRTAGCRKCGSSLARAYLRDSTCRVCGESLLSDTAKGRIERSAEKVRAAKARLEEEERKAKDAARKAAAKQKDRKVRWLVKIEYHT